MLIKQLVNNIALMKNNMYIIISQTKHNNGTNNVFTSCKSYYYKFVLYFSFTTSGRVDDKGTNLPYVTVEFGNQDQMEMYHEEPKCSKS